MEEDWEVLVKVDPMKTPDFLAETTTEVVTSSETEGVRGHAVEKEETEGPLIVVGEEVENDGQRDGEVVAETEREKEVKKKIERKEEGEVDPRKERAVGNVADHETVSDVEVAAVIRNVRTRMRRREHSHQRALRKERG